MLKECIGGGAQIVMYLIATFMDILNKVFVVFSPRLQETPLNDIFTIYFQACDLQTKSIYSYQSF